MPDGLQSSAADAAALALQVASTRPTDLQPSPIEPSWIMEGTPTARGLTLAKADDDLFSCGLWDCTAGRFKFIYYCDEIVHILDGEVIIDDGKGPRTLRAGDVAFFPEGLTTCWTVPTYVRKFCIHRTAPRSLLKRIRTKLGKFWRSLISRLPLAA